MGKGGGGGFDTSGLEAATREANALLKENRDLTREDAQPWYQMGSGSVNLLSDLLGVSGGSVKSRDQLMDSMRDDYTTHQSNSSGLFTDQFGNVKSGQYFEGLDETSGNYYDRDSGQTYLRDGEGYALYDRYAGKGEPIVYKPHETSKSITDYDALNAAIDAELAGQTTPDNYGQLLDKFSMEDFEADPGFQFRQDEANKQLERQMAAQGITLGGGGFGEINPAAYRSMQELNQGLASQEYGASRGRFIEDQLNTFNMLMGASGMGQNAVTTMANAGAGYASGAANNLTSLASAQQNAQLAQGSQPSMFGQLLGAGVSLAGLF